MRITYHRLLRRAARRLYLWFGIFCLLAFQAHAQAPLSLAEALKLSRTQPLLQSQRAAMTAASEMSISARQLPDPKLRAGILNLPVTGSDALSLSRDSMTMRMVGVMQEFPRAEKRELRGRRAEIERDQRVSELAFTQRAIERDVALAWTDALYAQRLAELLKELMSEADRRVDSLMVSYRAGKTPQADIFAARIDRDLLADRSAQFKREEQTARAELSRWIGEAAMRPLAGDEATLSSPPTLDELLNTVARHPHLSVLEKQVGLAENEAELARVGTRPDWNLELAYGYRGAPNSDMVTLQVGIDLPIFQRNRQLREVSAKLAAVEQARGLRADNLNEMRAMIRRYHAQWSSEAGRIDRFQKTLLPLARARVDAALAAYRGGRGELMPVLEARRMELDLRMQQLMLEADAAKAWHQLNYFVHR